MSEPSINKPSNNVYSLCGRACVPFDESKARKYWALIGGGHTKNRAIAQAHAEAIAKIIRESEK